MAAEEDLIERCEFIHVHEDIVAKVTENMPDEETLYDLADLFRLFADSTRIKILYVLFESEMCVCDIAQLLGTQVRAAQYRCVPEALEAILTDRPPHERIYIAGSLYLAGEVKAALHCRKEERGSYD